MYKITLMLVEDNAVVRDGLVRMLSGQRDFEVLAGAGSGEECLSLLEKGVVPEIILVDLNMAEMGGIALTGRILSLGLANVKVVILTMHGKQAFIEKAFEAGAMGYLLKDGDFEDMYHGIRQVKRGICYTSAGL